MQTSKKNALKWCWLSVIVIVLDQLSKYWVETHLIPYQPLPVLPFFNLTLMHNTGAAFSFLSRTGNLSTWLFSMVAIVVSIVLIAYLRRIPAARRWMACALALVLGGALGNLLDRFTSGYVIDFLDFYYQHWHFAAFNLADSAITVGAAMLLIEAFFFKREPS
ncbi:MAG TPA: signal peptidase II [Gammaproteobacteria bacterium]|nr:signal peptidase II [Gammaproteobacteria bacterium]